MQKLRKACSPEQVTHALVALELESNRIAALDWPRGVTGLEAPGLYSWWVDDEGAGHLAGGLGFPIAPGRVYVGQTGAGGESVLKERIEGNHLSGKVYFSTFRRTFASVLRHHLGLVVVGPSQLSPASEEKLSIWMRRHLSLAVHPFEDREALEDLEARVLERLDPPLNLKHMARTDLRTKLKSLRRKVKGGK